MQLSAFGPLFVLLWVNLSDGLRDEEVSSHTHSHKWILLTVGEDDDVSIRSTRLINKPFPEWERADNWTEVPLVRDGQLFISFPDDQSIHGVVQRVFTAPNPRYRFFDWGPRKGTYTTEPLGFLPVTVPSHVGEIKVHVAPSGSRGRIASVQSASPVTHTLKVPDLAPILRVIDPLKMRRQHAREAKRNPGVARRATSLSNDTLAVDPDCVNLGAKCVVDSGLVHCSWQQYGSPSILPSYVLLSGGFLASQQGTFCRQVSQCLTSLVGTDPWRPFQALLNFYSIFQVSPEEGATHPRVVSGAQNADPSKIGVEVNNNLGCSYGKNIERALACDYELVHALAATAPGSDVAIVIVNDPLHGGTGGGGVGAVSNGATMTNTIVHEIGHAHGGLGDEYDYGFTETRSLPIPNCWLDNGNKSSIPWFRWLPSTRGVAEYAKARSPTGKERVDELVVNAPVAICGYSNYGRSTATLPSSDTSGGLLGNLGEVLTGSSGAGYDGQACLMESDHPAMCPACREAMTNALFKKGAVMSSPRLPLKEEVVHIASTAGHKYNSVSLFISKILADQNQFTLPTDSGFRVSISWVVPGVASAVYTLGSIDHFVNSGECATAGQNLHDCDKPSPWKRRNGNELVYLPGSQLPAALIGTSFEVVATVNDITEPMPWSGTLPGQSVAKFRVHLHDGTTDGDASTWGCVERNRTLDTHNIDWLHNPPRTRLFPDYELVTGCAPTDTTAACWRPRDTVYCSTCDVGADCDLDWQTHEYTQPTVKKHSTFKDLINSIGIVTGVIGLVSLIGGVVMYFLITRCLRRVQGKEIVPLSSCAYVHLYFVKFVFMVLILAVVIISGGAFYLYAVTTDGLFGVDFVKYILIACVILYLIYFFCLAAIVSKRRLLVTITAVVLAIILGGSAYVTYFLYSLGRNLSLAGIQESQDHLGKLWKEAVQETPTTICGFQSHFKCSGFYHSCHNVPPNSYCSDIAECVENSNFFTDPCFEIIRTEISDNALWVNIVCFVFTGIMLLAFISSIAILFSIRRIHHPPSPHNTNGSALPAKYRSERDGRMFRDQEAGYMDAEMRLYHDGRL